MSSVGVLELSARSASRCRRAAQFARQSLLVAVAVCWALLLPLPDEAAVQTSGATLLRSIPEPPCIVLTDASSNF